MAINILYCENRQMMSSAPACDLLVLKVDDGAGGYIYELYAGDSQTLLGQSRATWNGLAGEIGSDSANKILGVFEKNTFETPTANMVGNYYLYRGATDTYINNCWYKVISDGQTPATYSYERVSSVVDNATLEVNNNNEIQIKEDSIELRHLKERQASDINKVLKVSANGWEVDYVNEFEIVNTFVNKEGNTHTLYLLTNNETNYKKGFYTWDSTNGFVSRSCVVEIDNTTIEYNNNVIALKEGGVEVRHIKSSAKTNTITNEDKVLLSSGAYKELLANASSSLTYDSTGATDSIKIELYNNNGDKVIDLSANYTGKIVYESVAQTLTNKTIDVDDNTLSNIETDNFKNTAIAKSEDSIRNYASAVDTKLATEKFLQKTLQNIATPLNNNDAVNKSYVDDEIAKLSGKSFRFIGFISSTEPTGTIQEGSIWYEGSTTPTTFPINVKTYSNSEWSATTTEYTPTNLDLWSNLENSKGYYWFGNVWNLLDENVLVDNSTIEKNGQSQLQVKDSGITFGKINSNAIASNITDSNNTLARTDAVYDELFDNTTSSASYDDTGLTDTLEIDLKNNSGTSKIYKTIDFGDKLVLETKSQTITNKTISADDNTITNIDHTNLKASTSGNVGKTYRVGSNGSFELAYIKEFLEVATFENVGGNTHTLYILTADCTVSNVVYKKGFYTWSTENGFVARSSIVEVDNSTIGFNNNNALEIKDNGITNAKLGTDIKIGSLSSLTTTAKSNIVGAMNELDSDITTLNSNKLDKVSTTNKVYGTDNNGNQTTYDKDSFGQVDDVKVDNVSVVSNKVANIDLSNKEDKTTIGTLSNLTTDIKTSIVNAINWVVSNFQRVLTAGDNIDITNNTIKSFPILEVQSLPVSPSQKCLYKIPSSAVIWWHNGSEWLDISSEAGMVSVTAFPTGSNIKESLLYKLTQDITHEGSAVYRMIEKEYTTTDTPVANTYTYNNTTDKWFYGTNEISVSSVQNLPEPSSSYNNNYYFNNNKLYRCELITPIIVDYYKGVYAYVDFAWRALYSSNDTIDYNYGILENTLPKINGVIVKGEKASSEYGIMNEETARATFQTKEMVNPLPNFSATTIEGTLAELDNKYSTATRIRGTLDYLEDLPSQKSEGDIYVIRYTPDTDDPYIMDEITYTSASGHTGTGYEHDTSNDKWYKDGVEISVSEVGTLPEPSQSLLNNYYYNNNKLYQCITNYNETNTMYCWNGVEWFRYGSANIDMSKYQRFEQKIDAIKIANPNISFSNNSTVAINNNFTIVRLEGTLLTPITDIQSPDRTLMTIPNDIVVSDGDVIVKVKTHNGTFTANENLPDLPSGGGNDYIKGTINENKLIDKYVMTTYTLTSASSHTGTGYEYDSTTTKYYKDGVEITVNSVTTLPTSDSSNAGNYYKLSSDNNNIYYSELVKAVKQDINLLTGELMWDTVGGSSNTYPLLNQSKNASVELVSGATETFYILDTDNMTSLANNWIVGYEEETIIDYAGTSKTIKTPLYRTKTITLTNNASYIEACRRYDSGLNINAGGVYGHYTITESEESKKYSMHKSIGIGQKHGFNGTFTFTPQVNISKTQILNKSYIDNNAIKVQGDVTIDKFYIMGVL